MFFLGVLALFQIVFLPGFLLLTALRYREGFLKTVLLSFGLSITINYFLILTLTFLHLYTPATLISLYCIECLMLLCMISFKNLLTPTHFSLKPISTFFSFTEQSSLITISKLAGFFAFVYLICFYSFYDDAPKSVFSSWDAILSWNPWAQQWAQNILPPHTSDYPQLIPINVSLTYLIVGNQLELFGKIFFYTFPFAILGILWDLANRNKQAGFFWGMVFFIVFLLKIFGNQSISGYADIPVASMCLFSLYLLFIENTPRTDCKKSIFLSVILTMGAISTKQAGLLVMAAYPIFLYLFLSKNFPFYSTTQKIKISLLSLLLIIASLIPWESYKLFLYYHHLDYSNSLPLLEGAGDQVMRHNYFLKVKHSLHLLFRLMDKNFLVIIVPILIILSCYSAKKMRPIALWLVLPMFLMWALFFGYDVRNIAYLLPFLSIVLGFGFQFLLQFLSHNRFVYFLKTHGILAYTLLSVLITLGGLLKLNHTYKNKKLINQQFIAMKQIGIPQINDFMYTYINKNPLAGIIMTNYGPLCYLTSFTSNCFYRPNLLSLDLFLKNLSELKPSYIGLLTISSKTKAIKEYVANHPEKFEMIESHVAYFNLYYIRGSYEKS